MELNWRTRTEYDRKHTRRSREWTTVCYRKNSTRTTTSRTAKKFLPQRKKKQRKKFAKPLAINQNEKRGLTEPTAANVEAAKPTALQTKASTSPPEQETQTLAKVPGRSDGVGSWRRPSKVPVAKGGASRHRSNAETEKPQSQIATQQPTRPRKLLAVSNSLSFKDVAARNTKHETDEQKTDAIAALTTPAAPEYEATDPSTQGVTSHQPTRPRKLLAVTTSLSFKDVAARNTEHENDEQKTDAVAAPTTPPASEPEATDLSTQEVSGPTTPERPANDTVTTGDSSSETELAGELAWGEEEAVHAEDPVYVPLTVYLSEEDAKAVVQEQLEYYFSVENLCKDIFLRKHMDCEGHVPLSFVAAFSRMLTLTEDLHLVRRAANAATSLEYDASNDTVRVRDGWSQWLWPAEDGRMGLPLWTKVDDNEVMESLQEEAYSLDISGGCSLDASSKPWPRPTLTPPTPASAPTHPTLNADADIFVPKGRR